MDVITPEGLLLGKISFPGVIVNVEFAGKRYNEVWGVGLGGVFRMRIKDQGVRLGKRSGGMFRIQKWE